MQSFYHTVTFDNAQERKETLQGYLDALEA